MYQHHLSIDYKGNKMKVNLISYSQAEQNYKSSAAPPREPYQWAGGRRSRFARDDFKIVASQIEPSQSVQELIAYCARVSNPGNQNNKETSEKLIKYLIKNKHWSPLEMASACLEIETTRDIARQILRHRSFSFQEFSQRYADPTKDLKYDDGTSYETRDARFQDKTNRQNSIDFDPTDEPQRRLNENFRMQQMKIWWAAKKTY